MMKVRHLSGYFNPLTKVLSMKKLWTKLLLELHKYLAAKAVKQGYDHPERITEHLKVLVVASRREFYEDNKPTLDRFLQECFDNALKASR